ncbi:MAG: hypothetical protein AAF485_23490, partial [Chloroflexota bacterium]
MFGTIPDSNGWPLDAALQFTTTITQVQATFTYTGMENGLPWERVWYFGTQELVRGSGVWDAGAAGHLTLFTQVQSQEFVPGRYRLALFVDGELVTEGSFVLVEPDTPTTKPIQVAYTVWDNDHSQIQMSQLEAIPGNIDSVTIAKPIPVQDFARYPTWSPTTDEILYYGETGLHQDETDGTSGLWLFNNDQNQSHQVAEANWPQSLMWSPNGTQVASATDDPQLIIWAGLQNTPFSGPPGEQPAWSPEGLRLAYRGCSGEGWGMYTANVISTTIDIDSIRQLTTSDDYWPSWSPDGQKLVFMRRNDDKQTIFSLDIDGTNLTQLTSKNNLATTPVWTPGGKILYRMKQDNQWGLYLMETDGSNPQFLLETPSNPEWRPDPPAVSRNQILVEPTPTPPPKPRVEVPA